MQNGHLIAIYCKALSNRSMAKSAHEMELMVLVLAIQHWRPYMVSNKF